MPLARTDTGNEIRGRTVPNRVQEELCHRVIAQFNFSDLGRGAGTLHQEGGVRLDMQGRTAAGVNIQVQIGQSTVAAAIVNDTVQQTSDPNNQRGAANAVISVLEQSMDSGTIWNVTGSLP